MTANTTTLPNAVIDSVAERWPVVATGLLAFLTIVLLQTVFKKNPLSSIPWVGLDAGGDEKRRLAFLAGAKEMYADGYYKFKDGVFRIATGRDSNIVVVAPKFLNELRKLPDDVLSFAGAVHDGLQASYTKIDTDVPVVPHTIKSNLTPSLSRLNPAIADEVGEAMRTELPSDPDWTPVNIHNKLLRIVAMVSGRVFIGSELCRDETYLDAAINYTTDLMAAVRAVQTVRPWLRRWKAPNLPEVKKLDQRERAAVEFLRPVVQARRKLAEDGFEKPDDMLQWLMDGETKFGRARDRDLAKYQLGLSFAAIHTTTLTATNAFYNLAAMPELIPMLREDIRTALDENDGVFTSSALQSMKKLDSFLKETLRFHPLSAASFQRKVMRTFALSNGQVIPAGVIVEAPAYGINRDPDIYPDCDTFDALRFYNLRQQGRERVLESASSAASVAQNQFIGVGQHSLTFGYGRHACPGRFFAANEIKMILAVALLQYDVALVEGSEGRYRNLEFGGQSIPDPTKEVLFRKVV